MLSYIILLGMTVLISVVGFIATGELIAFVLFVPVIFSVIFFGAPIPKRGELAIIWTESDGPSAPAGTRTAAAEQKPVFTSAPSAKAKSEAKGWGAGIIKRK